MRAQLATVTIAEGKAAAAVRDLRTAVGELAHLGPPDGHYTLFDARLYLGRALLKAGQASAAEQEFRAVLAYRQRTLPPAHPQLAVVNCDLARALAACGHNDQARPLLEACVPRLQSYGLMARSAREEMTRLWEGVR